MLSNGLAASKGSVISGRVMSVQLDQIVPWGRSLAEYQLMFDLTDSNLGGTILGCGDGPASD